MKWICLSATLVACALSLTPHAQGGEPPSYTDTRLSQVATDAAGVHITVDCYASYNVWRHDWDQDDDQTEFGTASGGSNDFVFLSPTVCSTLVTALDQGPAAAGSRWSALSILTLLHVAIYQGNVVRGFIHGWRNEGATSCTALKRVPQYAARFGFTQQVPSVSWRAVKRRGKIVRWHRVVKQVPNPAYAQLLAYAANWHQFLYGATCA